MEAVFQQIIGLMESGGPSAFAETIRDARVMAMKNDPSRSS